MRQFKKQRIVWHHYTTTAVSRVKTMCAGLKRCQQFFFKAIERKVVFSLTKKGEVWWSSFLSRVTIEEGSCTFPSS
jgi:hypothetical protein